MKPLWPVTITKMSGTGNTFALIDARAGSAWKKEEQRLGMSRPEFAKLICDRVIGVSTDGLLLIEEGSEGYDFNWDFYNSDGSTAEMCGNAARCAARFCRETLSGGSSLRFKTGAGLVTAQVLEKNQIRVRMPEAKFVQKNIELKTSAGSVETFALVNTGVPHLVQKISEFSQVESLKTMAKEMRNHAALKPAGANVTFYSEETIGKLLAVTFERGVEDYTLACGTGAVAAAFVHAHMANQDQVNVQMPGGLLQVTFEEENPCPLMVGEAVFVGNFNINLEVVK
ncbi:diaminopimelate epimerase [Bdellovibrio sp. 22V]|uniref:diaminopimelate epimerase n=1 Tax=Bdellovibrio TaxID=958 RepID=UPI00254316F0|nr:diaminopimelate epimerase [Bdellovibrio sp. 22V]WII72978.1 diaminopimelate epimerase [Bdellovibrio sp. 22V]